MGVKVSKVLFFEGVCGVCACAGCAMLLFGFLLWWPRVFKVCRCVFLFSFLLYLDCVWLVCGKFRVQEVAATSAFRFMAHVVSL